MSKEPNLANTAHPRPDQARANGTQAAVIEVWAEVLQRTDIKPTDNFFDLGGDSLKALDVIARLQASQKLELPLIAFFEDPTIAHLANAIDQLRPPRTASAQAADTNVSRSDSGHPLQTVEKVWREVLARESIAATDNFFDLGGDSLKALEVISRLQEELKVELPMIAFFEEPTIDHLASRIAQLREEKPQAVVSAEILAGEAPLSFAQLQYWLLQQADPLGYLYNEVRIVRIRGEFDRDLLRAALNQIARRQQVLGTRLELRLEEPVQVIDRDPQIGLEFRDLSHLPANTRESTALSMARDEGRGRFELSADFPIRAQLLALSSDDHVLVITVHHVATDGYSSTILFRELSSTYESLRRGSGEALPALARQYWEYAAAERERQGARMEKQLEFWRSQLDGAPRELPLPSDKVRPEPVSPSGRTLRTTISPSAVTRLKQLAESNGTTLFGLLTAALRLLLHRWTGEQDIVLGTVSNNRSGPGTDRMLGCFLNFLPLRNRVSPAEDALTLILREKQVILDAFAHQDCPFLKIAGIGRRTGEANPVYNVALLLQNFPELEFSGTSFRSEFLDFEADTALLDLRFIATERKGEVQVACEFRAQLFEESTIDSLLAGFARVLEEIANHPQRRISEFALPTQLLKQAEAARARDRISNIAISSTFTAEPVESPLAFWMRELGVRAKFEFAPYNQVFQQLLDPQSMISRNRDGINILLLRLTDSLRFSGELTEAEQKEKIERHWAELADALKGRQLGATTLVCLCPAESKFARNPGWSEFLDHVENQLAAALSRTSGIHVIQSKEILDLYPVASYEDTYADQIGHIPYTEDFFIAAATLLARRMLALQSSPKKVIVLDCDNTLWKGVCAEEGPTGVVVDAPRRQLQEFMLAQVQAGMLLCLCSKNIEEDVDLVFAQNPGMLLRPEHIVARRINWESKSTNLRALSAELQLGLDSFVLVDDNPIECAEVAAQLPEVLSVSLPPAENDIAPFLRRIWAFDHWRITEEDAQRTAMYQQNAGRKQLRNTTATLADFIAGLRLNIDVRPMQEADLTRVSQLTERTNQFNFTTIRRSEAAVEQFLQSGGNCLVVNLSDRFGDYGLVGVVFYETLKQAIAVDTFLLSCRALGRQVEHHMLARLGDIAIHKGLARVEARLVPSKKNQPAGDFLNKVGAEFRHPGESCFWYRFPAEYAGHVHLQSEPDLSGEEVAGAKAAGTASMRGFDVTQNRILLRIATDLFDVHHIARAVEAERAMRPQEAEFVSARTPIEEIIALTWAQVLKLDGVGVHDNFFALGGHSLAATQVVARLRQALHVELPLAALFEAPTVAELATRVEKSKSTEETKLPPLSRRTASAPAPVSFGQKRLWFLDQLEPGNPIYNVGQMFRMRGALDVSALAHAIHRVVERHDALRTTFRASQGEPVQIVRSELRIEVPVTDFSGLDPETREAELNQLAFAEASRAFDLANGPLIRAQLVKLAGDDHALLLTTHHIISDRWSTGVFAEELTAHYEGYLQSKPGAIADLPVQYPDFAVWQREWLSGEVLHRQLGYWKEQLRDAPRILDLPTDRPRPPVMSLRGATQSVILPQELVDRLTNLSRTEGVTLFMTLLATFETLLARYSGQEDMVVGSPIAGRQYAEIEPLIGFFVNTLALRGKLSGDPTFRELLLRTREVCLQAYAHQDLPFEKLVEELHPERSLAHSPIFQVMFALQNAPIGTLRMPGLQLERGPVYNATSMFDMSWFAVEHPDGLMIRAEYSTDLFDDPTITRALRHFQNLLEASLAHPDRPISQLPILSQEERHQVLVEFNRTAAEWPRLCIHNLLEQTAERLPDNIAVICGEERIRYRELNQRANQIAHYLRRLGAGPDVLVGVHMERTPDLVPAIFGVLKSGSAYVPLDPSYPRERLTSIVEDSQARIVVTQRSLLGQLPNPGVHFVPIDAEPDWFAQESAANPHPAVTPDNLAYVLFTSGSTGRPKGVALEHHNNVTFVQWAQTVFTPEELAGVLFCTSIGFDMSTFEMFITAAAGGKMILAENPLYLPALPAKDEVTLINTVPSAIAELVRMNALPPSLTTVALAGEALPESLVEQIYRSGGVNKVYNLYGPTESGYSTWTLVPRGGRVSIGRPIANEQCYILDQESNPAPIGVPGELYLAGEGLARGYFGRPDLTRERFLPNPFSAQRNPRMYKTGDLCRWLPDGNIEYLGRIDHQVKLRGFRVELGEIETVLTKHAAVRQCLVVAREDQPGMKRLVAYVVLEDAAEAQDEALAAHLKQSLPDYMIPAAFVYLEEFPLTSNRKIDRQALPAPEYKKDRGRNHIAPRNPIEEKIAAIWAEVLHLEPEKVSADDGFFALGGHSLSAAQVISRLRQTLAVEIPLKAIFESPVLEVLAARIQAANRGLEIPPITRVSRATPIPASFAQQRVWFLDQLEPDNPTFNIPYTMKISGPLDADAIEKSLNRIVERHESLRTSFATAGDDAVQVIHDSVALPLRRVDLSGLGPQASEAEARRLIAEDANRAFDLSQAPLARATYFKLSQQSHYLLINIHHIVSDRWSLGVLTQELAATYAAVCEGKTPELPPLPLQYADYSVWQRQWLRGDPLERQLEYWKEKLKDVPPVLELPTDRPRPASESFRGDVAYVTLPRPLHDKLNRLSRDHGATLFMTLLAGFQALLSRYSGQDDIVVGTAIANRTHPDLEKVIGFFLNTLPLRTRFHDDPSFVEILTRAKETALGAYAHQDMPFEKLVEELRPERSLSHSPLVQVFFVLQNAPTEFSEMKGLALRHVPSGTKTVKGDMYLSMHEGENGIEGRLEYSTDLFDAATMERLLGHFQVLLEAAADNPELKLSELPLLTQAERRTILMDWQETYFDYPRDACLHQLFEQQAARTPDAVACVFPGDTPEQDRFLSYRELNQRANQLAHALLKRGAGRGRRIGIFTERSLEMMVGLLAIQKSGAAYVPLDPAYPAERIRLTLEDAQVALILTQESLLPRLPGHHREVLCLDRDWRDIREESASNLGKTASPEDVVYVIFTSGSTGRPKGVQVPHRAVVNLLDFMGRELGMGPDDAFPALASFAFDMCIPELYLALVTGGRVVIGRKDLAANGEELSAWLERTGSTIVHATPTTWRLLLEAGFSGKGWKRAIGAEALPQELCRRLLTEDASLYNFYGPTETTVWSTWHHFTSPEEPVVVGRPISNTQVYILDRHLQPVPAGIYGEIYISGDGVTQGYLNRPELTAEKFLSNPFAGRAGAKMYRTGDVGRFLADGRIEFQGRADYQVKVRGYRIELGDIETVIGRHPAVNENVVLAREDVAGDKRLVSYFVARPEQRVDAAELRSWAKERLPEYMVPVAWVGLEKLPLSANGKVDRKQLPIPEYSRPESLADYSRPRTPEEEIIAGVWAEVLKLPQIGIEDDFFELGGHSLLATQVVSRIRHAFNVQLPLRDLFEAPTVAGLAERISALGRKRAGIETPPIQRASRQGPIPLSFAQRRLWFLDQLEPGNPLYNVASVARVEGELNYPALEKSLNEIVRRHESLRTTFPNLDNEPRQVIAPHVEIKLVIRDASQLGDLTASENEARRLAGEEIQRPFDLATGPLLRALAVRIGPGDHALILNMHHILSDRWSLAVLTQELAALYEANLKGQPSPLPELEIQYADYAAWQHQFLSGEVLDRQLRYWRQKLEGAPPVLEIPSDHSRGQTQPFWGAHYIQQLPPQTIDQLKTLSRRERGTFYISLLAGFELLMGRLAGQDDLVIGTDLANRNQLETERLIGFFVNLLPMRARIDRRAAFTDFYQQIRETVLEAITHQDIPFDKLVEELRPERSLSHNPLVQVLFVMQNTPPLLRQFGGLKMRPLGVSSTSRFDLVVFINNPESDVSVTWMYNPTLFDRDRVVQMANRYELLLRTICADPDVKLESLFAVLDESEREQRRSQQEKAQKLGLEKLKSVRRKAIAEG